MYLLTKRYYETPHGVGDGAFHKFFAVLLNYLYLLNIKIFNEICLKSLFAELSLLTDYEKTI